MKPIFLPVLVFVVFAYGCTNLFNKKAEEKTSGEKVISPEELAAIEKARQDSLKQAEFEKMQKTAFGELMFGMEKDSVLKKGSKRQQLGKFSYNFNYSFNNENRFFKLRLVSDGVRALEFDTQLKNRYDNLFKIIHTRYGEPVNKNSYPSVFDVQEHKKYQISKWVQGTKEISMGLQQNGMNSYSVYCEIFDKNMDEAEQQRLKNLKNKDIIDAASKF